MLTLKNIKTCTLAIGVACVVALPAAAQDKLEAITSNGVVQMGVAVEPPYSEMLPDGTLSGADPEIARAIFSELGEVELSPNVVDWGALIPGLMAGRFDAVATGLFIRPERCEAVLFSEPVLCTTEAFIVRKGNPKGIKTYQQLVDSDAMFSSVAGAEEKRALDLGMPANRIMVTPDIFGSVDLLKSGRVDLIGFPDTTLAHALTLLPDGEFELVSNLDGEPVQCSAAAFGPGQEALRDFYDAGLVKLKESGEFDRIVSSNSFNPKLNDAVSRTSLCGAEN